MVIAVTRDPWFGIQPFNYRYMEWGLGKVHEGFLLRCKLQTRIKLVSVRQDPREQSKKV